MRFKSIPLCFLALALGYVSWLSPRAFASDGAAAAIRSHAEEPDGARAILAKYFSIPKGVVLEGTATGFDPLTSVTYSKDTNEFTLNEKMRYPNPISRKEFKQVFEALCKDDRIGVTLVEGETRVYGRLSSSSDMVTQMAETDRRLGGILFAIEWIQKDFKLPGGYTPKRAVNRKIPVVAFSRFKDYAFSKSGDKYERASCDLDVRLIPLSTKKTAQGGHLPDLEKSKDYVMEPTDRENIEHLKKHQAEYLKIPAFAKTAATGEAAAFARLVRDAKLDSKKLLKQF